jgi:hypothetical protein
MRTRIRLALAHALIAGWTRVLYLRLAFDLRLYRRRQRALAARYALAGMLPDAYGPAMRARITEAAVHLREPHVFVLTSGTTAEPKRILYTRRRLRRTRQTILEQALLGYRHLHLSRPVFYTLTDLLPTASLSGTLAHRYRMTLSGRFLQRVVFVDSFIPAGEMARLAAHFSQDAVHLACMALISPTVLIVVNPSSVFTILAAERDWEATWAEVIRILDDQAIVQIQHRLGPAGSARAARLRARSARGGVPHPADLLPDLRAVYCWDGGYVRPYIEHLRRLFGDQAPEFFPMFSMSTETIAYEIFPRASVAGGFPISPGVCYEFLAEESGRAPAVLLKPWELEPDRRYVMVVSDRYGLRRYNTEDVFVCVGMVRDAPLLRFLHRAGLAYSFTGEKLTGEQLSIVYDRIRSELGIPDLICTCFPTHTARGIPGYVFTCWVPPGTDRTFQLTGDLFDRFLRDVNLEYDAKRASGRLAAPQVRRVSDPGALERIAARGARHGSPAQSKVLPLSTMPWDQAEVLLTSPLVPLVPQRVVGASGEDVYPARTP